MKAQQLIWKNYAWTGLRDDLSGAQLVILFASREALEDRRCIDQLRTHFNNAEIVGCSTGGNIAGGDVSDDFAAALAMKFDRAKLQVATEEITNPNESFDVGVRLALALQAPQLRSILVLSDGLCVNGSRLIEGMRSAVGNEIVLTGGLAGDGAAFNKTVVAANGIVASGRVTAVGFYGAEVVIGHGCAGGWDAFGPRRTITASEGNTLYSLDGKPALDLYKRYLGADAAGLPGTALLYPLTIVNPEQPDQSMVRTVLAVDHERGTMTFAGDIPQGWSAQLMRGHFDNLSAGAAEAARSASIQTHSPQSEVAAVLISCIGRRLLMGESIVDEIDAATKELGDAQVIGFYSYGEISPHAATGCCELHNQTMTVTTFAEAW
ncbi:MAG TPA: FIST N-terminal domain-containing protein [Hyphomicrobiaceae bacterium]|nr:FIST N-terminal domain-containing protein [Hyphomicrobiaceae bacterium]